MSAEHSRPRKSSRLEQTRQLMRARHLSIRTEEAYLRWIEEFLRYHRDQQGEWVHPGQMGNAEISAYLTQLGRVALLEAVKETRGCQQQTTRDRMARKFWPRIALLAEDGKQWHRA